MIWFVGVCLWLSAAFGTFSLASYRSQLDNEEAVMLGMFSALFWPLVLLASLFSGVNERIQAAKDRRNKIERERKFELSRAEYEIERMLRR